MSAKASAFSIDAIMTTTTTTTAPNDISSVKSSSSQYSPGRFKNLHIVQFLFAVRSICEIPLCLNSHTDLYGSFAEKLIGILCRERQED